MHQCIQVAQPAAGAQGQHGLELGPHPFLTLENAVFELQIGFAADGTANTAVGSGKVVAEIFTVDLPGELEGVVPEIAGCQNPGIVGPFDITGTPMGRHAFEVRGILHLPDIALDGFMAVFARTE